MIVKTKIFIPSNVCVYQTKIIFLKYSNYKKKKNMKLEVSKYNETGHFYKYWKTEINYCVNISELVLLNTRK